MNDFQEKVDRIYKSKRSKYPEEISQKLEDALLGEAIFEALAERRFSGQKEGDQNENEIRCE